MNYSNPFEFLLHLLSVIVDGFTGIVDFFQNTIGGLFKNISTGSLFTDEILDFVGGAIDSLKFNGIALGSYTLIELLLGRALPVFLVFALLHWIFKFRIS